MQTWSVYPKLGGAVCIGVGGARGVPGAKLSYGRGNLGAEGSGPPFTISPSRRLTLFVPTSEGERRRGSGEEGSRVISRLNFTIFLVTVRSKCTQNSAACKSSQCVTGCIASHDNHVTHCSFILKAQQFSEFGEGEICGF